MVNTARLGFGLRVRAGLGTYVRDEWMTDRDCAVLWDACQVDAEWGAAEYPYGAGANRTSLTLDPVLSRELWGEGVDAPRRAVCDPALLPNAGKRRAVLRPGSAMGGAWAAGQDVPGWRH